jgi:hypothetical protein
VTGLGDTFGLMAVMGPNVDEYQTGANAVAATHVIEDTYLVENMVGAWAQRCDTLMKFMQAGMAAPALIRGDVTLATYHEGMRSEAWLLYWNKQRRLVS